MLTMSHDEFETLVSEGLDTLHEDMLAELVPPHAGYRHDERERHRPNAHAHILSTLLGSSATIPIDAGRMQLGSYQSVFLVELDGPRARDVIVQVVGE